MLDIYYIASLSANIVTRIHRFSSITGPLSSLHWLPVRYRIQFKINLLTYKVYKTDYPVYLKDCVQPYSSAYSTRRSEPAQHKLNVPYYDYKQHKSFTHVSNSYFSSALRLWNSLPLICRCAPSLSAFRSRLKAYLWKRHFLLRFFFSISNFPSGSGLFFCSPTMSSIIPKDVRPECAFAQIRCYRNLIG